MIKKKYIRPEIEGIELDKDISLILMSHNDEYNPPDDPFGSSQAASQNPFEENAFSKPLK